MYDNCLFVIAEEVLVIPNYKKIEVLKVIINGGSLSEAGGVIGISSSRAKGLLNRLCSNLKLSPLIKDIRENPDEYIKRIEDLEKKPEIALRSVLVNKLRRSLMLNSEMELTPEYVSNLTASQLMACDITVIAIAEIQEWLSISGLCLKKRVPETAQEITEVKRAMAILDAFHFDTETIKGQLAYLKSCSS